jgi:nitrite reductase/ring-hydroxylating ferredoxin subunit
MITAVGFVGVASTKDVSPGKMLGVQANGKQILRINLDGKYYAIGNKCTHRGCMLSEGELRGEMVLCTCHRSRFAIQTGIVMSGPAKRPEPQFEGKVDGEQISAQS